MKFPIVTKSWQLLDEYGENVWLCDAAPAPF